MKLQDMTCEACRADAPKLTDEQLQQGLQQLPQWRCDQVDGVPRLIRQFDFKNFVCPLQFTNLIGELAEKFNHHPLIQLEWGRVEVHWWTHKIKGLHINDLVLAAKTDQLFDKNWS